jgi:hypothetical protein
MRSALPVVIGIIILSLFISVFLHRSQNASAATNHVVISEVQIGKTGAPYDEFIELYNPTNNDVNLNGWRLAKKSKTGSIQVDLITSFSGIIKAHGYLLITSNNYSGSISADFAYVASTNVSLSPDNSIALYDSLNSQIDLIGFDDSTTVETQSIVSPSINKSIERKASSNSDSTSMAIGGQHEFLGNGEDTDNNSVDFVTRAIPQPQNSASTKEPIESSPTPTLSPTPTIEPSPTPSPTPEPSPSPTLTPTPTLVPSPTAVPSPTGTPMPTVQPSPTPTNEPTPTLQPTQTPSPTLVLTPTPTPSISPIPPMPIPKIIAKGPNFVCTLNYKPWKILNKTFYLPSVSCARTSL